LQERIALSEEENAELKLKLSAMDALSDRLVVQESEWTEKLSAVEAEKGELSRQLNEVRVDQRELEELRATVSQDEEIVRQWESRASELCDTLTTLEEKVRSLQAELKQQEEDAVNAIQQWTENFSDLESKQANIEDELMQCQEMISSRDWKIEQLSAKSESYFMQMGELKVRSLQAELEQQEKDAVNVITQWSERVSELESKQSSIDVELLECHEIISSRDWKIEQLKAKSESYTLQVGDLKVRSLQAELMQQEKDAVNAITQWAERVSELESKQADMETELLQCHETISSHDWTIEQLKAKNESYALQVGELRLTAGSIEDDLVGASSEISRLTEVLESERQRRIDEREKYEAELAGERGRHAEARDEIETLTALLEENKIESEDIVNQWSGKRLCVSTS
jgi:chromosome segregation ATPase